MPLQLSWSATAIMLLTHAAECGRPRYVRTLLFYGPSLEGMYQTRFGSALAELFPALFGAKAIVCLTCRSYAYDGRFAGKILNVVRDVRTYLSGEDLDEIILYDPEDLKGLTEKERKALGFAEEES